MSQSAVTSHVIGFPRLGARREMKWALERYWSGRMDASALHAAMAELRQRHWQHQVDAGLNLLTAGDFAYYDHVLELSEALGVVPARHVAEPDRLARCFAMARGGAGGHASEMKKWFNTNYHYIVPELEGKQRFSSSAPGAMPPDVVVQVREAKEFGKPVKAALTGPLTYLYLSRVDNAGEFAASKLEIVDELAEAYVAILARLKQAGCDWLQLEEPILSLDMPDKWLSAMEFVYDELLGDERPQVMIASSYGSLGDRVEKVANIAVEGLHIDLPYGFKDLEAAERGFSGRVLSVGAVDGRNIWRANLPALHKHLERLASREGGLWIGSSCSMLHVPMDATGEAELHERKLPIAFARQKLDEIAALARTLSGAATDSDKELFASAPDMPMANPGWLDPKLPTPELRPSSRQGEKGWPGIECPTTTIGSLPQTKEIRAARASWRKGDLTDEQYEEMMRAEIKYCVEEQERLELDILVHGECERNDMVEYFAHYLDGIAFSQNGWVQSYGSRATRPPLIHGDIARPEPMTVDWSKYAASLTSKPMKAMLTGPVTIICWSFPRADVPKMRTADQLADALRLEVADLSSAGLKVIQIDEPALREGLPLATAEHADYLAQAVAAFNKIVAGCKDQIHTHMCYGEFNDVAVAIAAMDADVISLETSRTDMSVLAALVDQGHSAGVGPGVYDVHSPRVPSKGEMEKLLLQALEWVPRERLWVNPDCGLKTRGWDESRDSLKHMVKAAHAIRLDGRLD